MPEAGACESQDFLGMSQKPKGAFGDSFSHIFMYIPELLSVIHTGLHNQIKPEIFQACVCTVYTGDIHVCMEIGMF